MADGQPGPLRNLIASTTLAVANTTTTFAPANPNDDQGVAAGAMFWRPERRGARFWITISAISGSSATATFSVKEFNLPRNKTGNTLLASAALTATGATVLDIYPGLTASANAVASQVMSNFVITVAISNTTTPSVTFTVDVEYIP